MSNIRTHFLRRALHISSNNRFISASAGTSQLLAWWKATASFKTLLSLFRVPAHFHRNRLLSCISVCDTLRDNFSRKKFDIRLVVVCQQHTSYRWRRQQFTIFCPKFYHPLDPDRSISRFSFDAESEWLLTLWILMKRETYTRFDFLL